MVDGSVRPQSENDNVEDASYGMGKRRVWESSEALTVSAVRDIVDAVAAWPLWGRLGWQDVALRYRRSVLGPFWLTLSMGVMISSMGYLYSQLFHMEISVYLPFITLGLLVWNLISNLLNEGCQTYIQGEGLLRQVALPTMMFPLRVVWRNLIIFVHNFVVYLGVAVIFDIRPGWAALLAIPGLVLVLMNAVWVAMLLGMLSARFRDIPQIIGSIIQVLFFVTPIIWTPDLVGDRALIVDANPFFHFIEIIRGPLLGKMPTLLNWEVVVGFTVVGWLVSFLFHRRFHVRVAYWV